VKVAVDPDVCAGHAHCWSVCPEVFALTDDGYAVVVVELVPPELEAAVRAAALNCPTRAISVD